jgi:hypothetical protein
LSPSAADSPRTRGLPPLTFRSEVDNLTKT